MESLKNWSKMQISLIVLIALRVYELMKENKNIYVEFENRHLVSSPSGVLNVWCSHRLVSSPHKGSTK